MDAADASYQRAEIAEIQPAVSEIDAKAASGKGWLGVCREAWSDAQEQFRKVIRAYGPGDDGEVNARIEELAADAFFGLGLAIIAGAGRELEPAELAAAAAEFEQAGEMEEGLVADDKRRGLIHGWLGWLNKQLGNGDIAGRHCADALALSPDHVRDLCPTP